MNETFKDKKYIKLTLIRNLLVEVINLLSFN